MWAKQSRYINVCCQTIKLEQIIYRRCRFTPGVEAKVDKVL